MAQVTHDAADCDLIVGGRVIDQAAGLTGLNPDRNPTPIMKPGRVRVGVNRQRSANGADFTIRVLATSSDLDYLYGLVESQVEVPVKEVVVRNLDTYATGQIIALGCQFGVLGGGNMNLGSDDEAGVVEFTVTGRGQIRETKI